MRKILSIMSIFGLLLLVNMISTQTEHAEATTTLSNLGNTPIIDADIVAVAYVGQGFVVLAGQDYVLNSVTFTLSSVTGA